MKDFKYAVHLVVEGKSFLDNQRFTNKAEAHKRLVVYKRGWRRGDLAYLVGSKASTGFGAVSARPTDYEQEVFLGNLRGKTVARIAVVREYQS